jgi:Kef-type K+ transport system membrane component KefB
MLVSANSGIFWLLPSMILCSVAGIMYSLQLSSVRGAFIFWCKLVKTRVV